MKLAVKLYGEGNAQSIPAAWPSEVLPDVESLPSGYDLLFESVAEYEAYRAMHQTAYDAWAAAQVASTPVPQSVTPWQMRRALNQLGLRAMVEAAVAAGDQDARDGWEFALEIRRDNPLLAGMGAALGMTDAQLDDLFRLAASFQ